MLVKKIFLVSHFFSVTKIMKHVKVLSPDESTIATQFFYRSLSEKLRNFTRKILPHCAIISLAEWKRVFRLVCEKFNETKKFFSARTVIENLRNLGDIKIWFLDTRWIYKSEKMLKILRSMFLLYLSLFALPLRSMFHFQICSV